MNILTTRVLLWFLNAMATYKSERQRAGVNTKGLMAAPTVAEYDVRITAYSIHTHTQTHTLHCLSSVVCSQMAAIRVVLI